MAGKSKKVLILEFIALNEVVTLLDYDLHTMLAREMQPTLKGSAERAYEMGKIPKPGLTNLMNLFIGWGLAMLKKKWPDRVGYR